MLLTDFYRTLYCRELIPFFNFISPHSGAKPDSAYNLHPHFLGQVFFDHSPLSSFTFSFMLIIIKEILAKIKLTVSKIFWFQYLFYIPLTVVIYYRVHFPSTLSPRHHHLTPLILTSLMIAFLKFCKAQKFPSIAPYKNNALFWTKILDLSHYCKPLLSVCKWERDGTLNVITYFIACSKQPRRHADRKWSD